MQVAICSDIHGNRHAFEAVIAAAKEAGADEIWCLGDLVGYGAEPDRCVELAVGGLRARAWPATTTSRWSRSSRSRTSRAARRWPRCGRARRSPSATHEFLHSLKPQGDGFGYGLFHASPRDPVWEYVLSGLTAELCFDATDYRVSFIGHSHVALSFHRPEGEPASGSTRRDGDRARHQRPASG